MIDQRQAISQLAVIALVGRGRFGNAGRLVPCEHEH
jgi:hypothetical protein